MQDNLPPERLGPLTREHGHPVIINATLTSNACMQQASVGKAASINAHYAVLYAVLIDNCEGFRHDVIAACLQHVFAVNLVGKPPLVNTLHAT